MPGFISTFSSLGGGGPVRSDRSDEDEESESVDDGPADCRQTSARRRLSEYEGDKLRRWGT